MAGSGISELDAEALCTVGRASPVPPPLTPSGGSAMEVVGPVRFYIND